MIDELPLDKYAIANGEAGWEEAEQAVREGKGRSTFSVKSSKPDEKGKRKAGEALAEAQKEAENSSGKKSKKAKKGRA